MRPLRLALALVLAVALAGCLGDAAGPGIPPSALAAKQWGREGAPATSTVYGLAEVHQQAYGPGGSTYVGGALVVSVTDVPLLDEARFVPGEIAAYERAQGITMTRTGSETIALSNMGGREVVAQTYDVQAAGGLPARALIVETHCDAPDAFVVAVGYGALGRAGGLLGGAAPDIYREARDLVAALACKA